MLKKSLLIGLTLLAVAGVGHTAEGIMLAPDQMDWQEVNPGSPAIKRVILWGDRDKGEYAMLLKVAPGTVAPVHAHTGDYHGMSVKGIWRHSFDGGEERDLPLGSYVLQPGMAMHGDACVGPDECILFIHQYVKGDYIPKE
ncbi:MAG: DUF4437 domain-containing protein [Burkholderiales bacterium]|nr:DUF4437 domain-containing protein [Burkholderiales bacterium]